MNVRVGIRIAGWSLLPILLALGEQSGTMTASGLEVATQPVGLIQIPISPGANFISTPLHRIYSYRGIVATVAADSLTVAGDPAWTADEFAPQDGFYQFIVIVRQSTIADSNHEGDWWPIVSNSGNSLVVNKRSEDLSVTLQPGDNIELRRLTALKDLFGSGAGVVLNQDSDGSANPQDEDLIRYVVGTSFSTRVFYHNGSLGPEGYYVNGEGPYDGSTLTLWPDQPLMLFRKNGSPALTLKLLGQVQVTRLTHYLQPGANPIGTGFALPTPISASGLLESGFVSDGNGSIDPTEEDFIRTVVGTGFAQRIFHHDGSLGDAGWYVDGELNNAFPFEPGRGYIFFVKEPGPLRWPQAVP